MKRQRTARHKIKTLRQEYVASLLLRGLSERKITEVLATPTVVENGKEKVNPYYMLNPATQKPFALTQVHRDIQQLEEKWRASALANVDAHQARQLAELDELKRRAWAVGDFDIVLKAIQTEIKLLGTAAPERQEMRWDDKQFEVLAEQMSDDELARIAAGNTGSGSLRVITPPQRPRQSS
jgi:hypothetical protein